MGCPLARPLARPYSSSRGGYATTVLLICGLLCCAEELPKVLLNEGVEVTCRAGIPDLEEKK